MPATARTAAARTAPARRPKNGIRRARTRSVPGRLLLRPGAAAVGARCKWASASSNSQLVMAGLVPAMTFSRAERALGGRHFVLGARIDRHRGPQRARQALEAGLGDMVIVRPI